MLKLLVVTGRVVFGDTVFIGLCVRSGRWHTFTVCFRYPARGRCSHFTTEVVPWWVGWRLKRRLAMAGLCDSAAFSQEAI